MNEKRQTYIIDGDEKIIVAENLFIIRLKKDFRRLRFSENNLYKYLVLVKGYDISRFTFAKIVRGREGASEDLYNEIGKILNIIEESILGILFTPDEYASRCKQRARRNNGVVAIIVSDYDYFDRKCQRDNIKRYIGDSLYLSEANCPSNFKDSSWFDIKTACDLVISGAYSAIVLNDISSLGDSRLIEKFEEYTRYYDINVIQVQQMCKG